jgi:hypothetical protein
MLTPDTYLWFFLGCAMILGGCFCCLGCSHCTDWTDSATIQIDIVGTVGDEDEEGCCEALDRSYLLTQTSANACSYEVTYENGACLSAECEECHTTGCSGTCNEGPTTPCNPIASTCSEVGSTSHDINCTTCLDTEQGVTTFVVGTEQVDRCDCTCEPTGLIWDTDVMIADHPLATWAVTGEEVYYCDCAPKDCEATNGTSSVSMTATIAQFGSDTTVTVFLNMLSRGGGGALTITGNPIACATEIDGLAFTVGATGSGEDIEMSACGATNCLCGIPTSLAVTFIP